MFVKCICILQHSLNWASRKRIVGNNIGGQEWLNLELLIYTLYSWIQNSCEYFADSFWMLSKQPANTGIRIHYNDVIIGTMACQITSLTIVYSTVYSGADKKKLKLRVPGLCLGTSPMTGAFATQMASNAENVSIWWRHHELLKDSWVLVDDNQRLLFHHVIFNYMQLVIRWLGE